MFELMYNGITNCVHKIVADPLEATVVICFSVMFVVGDHYLRTGKLRG
jgi:hypothetical protein